jgi:cysteine desulfurase/selenocysteine lyase
MKGFKNLTEITGQELAPLLSPDAFVGIEGIAHLCTGGEAPWLKSQAQVYEEFSRLKGGSHQGRDAIYARGERCRERMGELWGVPANRIAMMPSAAEGMSWLARGLDWQPGDNIVTANLEFPSVAYAWRNLRKMGVEVRLVPHKNWTVHEADLLDAVDARTRVLAISHVGFYTGQCHNLVQLAEGAKKKGALFAVDATHSSGALQVPAHVSDLTVSSAYKWLLATHGVAPCYLSERAEAQIASTSFGWRNLAVWPAQAAERHADVAEQPMPEKMEPGNPAMQVVMHLDHALGVILDIGIEKIENHARDLSEQVSDGLIRLGYKVISPGVRAGRSGNTCFACEDGRGLVNQLRERNVYCWGEFGRVRVSTHLYNSSEDVGQLLDALVDIG